MREGTLWALPVTSLDIMGHNDKKINVNLTADKLYIPTALLLLTL